MTAVCRSTLSVLDEPGFTPAAMRKLFGKNAGIPFRLTFSRSEVIDYRTQEAEHFSISGVQDKISLRLESGQLQPCTIDGEFILKPTPGSETLQYRDDVPANEHLTMQLAGQVFGIQVPPCALVELSDGEPAYLVRRFDRQKDGTKIQQEDFCQLSNRSEETAGRNYKYDGSQEETGQLLKRYCAAYPVEIEKLYQQHLFNYIFSNGDAHLKNFSLQRSPDGDYLISPAYDLLCTSLHLPQEHRCALDLFGDDENETAYFEDNAFYGRSDFLLLADKFGIQPDFANAQIKAFETRKATVYELAERSFLSKPARKDYLKRFDDRLNTMR